MAQAVTWWPATVLSMTSSAAAAGARLAAAASRRLAARMVRGRVMGGPRPSWPWGGKNAAAGGHSAVGVEPAAGLLPQVPGLDLLDEEGAGAVLRVLEAVVEDVQDGEARVQANEICEGEGAHRVVHAEPHDGVDVFGRRDTLVEAEDGLVDHRHE